MRMSDEPVQFDRPDMVWVPLRQAEWAILSMGHVLRMEIPADEEAGLKSMVVMIRPPKEFGGGRES